MILGVPLVPPAVPVDELVPMLMTVVPAMFTLNGNETDKIFKADNFSTKFYVPVKVMLAFNGVVIAKLLDV